MNPRWQSFLGGLVLVLSLFHTSAALADTSAARSLAIEGKKAFDAKDYQAAVDYFEKAERQFHATTHLLMIALARIELGQLVEAQETLYTIANEALPSDANEVLRNNKEQAEQLIGELEAKIGALVLTVQPSDAPALAIEIDGKPLSVDLLGAPRRSNPGERTVVVTAQGFERAERTVTLPEGGSETLSIELVPVSGADDPEPANPAAAEDQDSAPRYRPLAYSALGLGVVGVTAGAVLLGMGLSDGNKADKKLEDECNTDPSRPRCTAETAGEIEDLDQSSADKKTGAVIGFSVGGAALATGMTLWILGGKKGDVALGRRVVVAPAVAPSRGGGQFVLEGRF